MSLRPQYVGVRSDSSLISYGCHVAETAGAGGCRAACRNPESSYNLTPSRCKAHNPSADTFTDALSVALLAYRNDGRVAQR
jgi:hypothetical protein